MMENYDMPERASPQTFQKMPSNAPKPTFTGRGLGGIGESIMGNQASSTGIPIIKPGNIIMAKQDNTY